MINSVDIKIEGEPLVYGTEHAAAGDLKCNENFTLYPSEKRIIKTGVKMAIPVGLCGLLLPRSGFSNKFDVAIANSPGLIDSDYRGEIGIIVRNRGNEPVKFNVGDRIAQLIITVYYRANFIQVNSLDETVRGEGGFGSTGK